MVKRLLMTFVALLAIAAATGSARAQATISGNQIDVFESSGTLSSDMTCTDFDVRKESMLTVNQGVTLTLNCIRFQLKQNSVIYLYGTMTGSAGSDVNWRDDSYINVYLSDGAKYTVTGLSCSDYDGDSYLRYHGYNAATDGHGTVSVTNGPTAVTDISIGYKTTTYTFTATPASGYRFVNWTKGAGGEELGTDASINVTCEQNGQYQVYANFEEDVPPQPHTVTFAEGTEDVSSWTIAPPEATTTGVLAGTPLTATYAGDLKVKEVIATKHLEPNEIPLTIEALTDGTVKVYSPKEGMQYSLNGGAKTAVTSAAINVSVGDKVAFYGDSTNITSYQGTSITGGTAEVKVYGNIMSLVNEEHFDTATTLSGARAFSGLFRGNDKLSDASGLLLPATTLTERCYMSMFERCVNLTTAPELPATTLAISCYTSMFYYCTSLTTAPALPAPVLAPMCYYRMFSNCTNLNSVTCLATDISATGCIRSWLDGAGSAVQGTKTFNAVSTTEWPTDDSEGIPNGWTRQNIDN